MQKPLEIPIAIGSLRGTLTGVGSYKNGLTEKELYPQQHNHTYYELHYVLQGSCTLQSSQKSYLIRPGHVLLIPPRIYHHFKSTEERLQKIDIAFELENSPTGQESSSVQIFDLFRKDGCIDLDIHGEEFDMLRNAILYVGSVIDEEREHTFLGREQLRVMSNVILVELYSVFSSRTEEKNERDDVVDSRVHKIESFIANHYNDKDTCEDLAEQLHVSQRQLTRIIRQLYNMSFREKVNEMRLQNAVELLERTDLSIAEIAERLGYSSPSNFSLFIKKQTGRTPTAIRLNENRPADVGRLP